MENQHQKIANINLLISEDCSEEDKKIIQLYWQLQETEFLNTPKSIKQKFNIRQSVLNRLNNTYALVSMYILCDSCNSYEKHHATSQSKFKEIIRLKEENRYPGFYNCEYCKEVQQKQLDLEQQKKNRELLVKLKDAVENKNWKNLSNFDKAVLKNSLEMNFDELKSHYGSKLGYSNFIQLIRALENIEHQNLLILHRQSWNNYISSYQYIAKLVEHKDEIKIKQNAQNKPKNSVKMNTETNELKFKLTINEFQNHPDSPKFAGLVTFKQKIIIEPNVEYVFGQWQRTNDQLYLTLIPKENMGNSPSQKRVSNTPIHIRKGITEFLNYLGENLDF